MTGILHTYIPNRVIDSNGIADGSSLAFYYTGTLTPAPIYTTDALTVEKTNPVVVGAGAAVPDFYLDPAITYRRIVTFSDGSTQDTDPWMGIPAANTGALSVKDAPFGARGDGTTDDTDAIQDAIDELGDNGVLLFPPGTYLLTAPLTFTNLDNIQIIGYGAKIKATTRFTSYFSLSGSTRVYIEGFEFDQAQPVLSTYETADYNNVYNVAIHCIASSDLVTVSNCLFTNLYTCSVYFKNSGSLRVENCRFTSPEQDQDQHLEFIFIETNAGQINIEGNEFIGATTTTNETSPSAVAMSGLTGKVTIAHNKAQHCGRNNAGGHRLGVFDLYTDAANVTVTDNQALNCREQFMRLSTSVDALVAKNKISVAAEADTGYSTISIESGSWPLVSNPICKRIRFRDNTVLDPSHRHAYAIGVNCYDWGGGSVDVELTGNNISGADVAFVVTGPYDGLKILDNTTTDTLAFLNQTMKDALAADLVFTTDLGTQANSKVDGLRIEGNDITIRTSSSSNPVTISTNRTSAYTGTIGSFHFNNNRIACTTPGTTAALNVIFNGSTPQGIFKARGNRFTGYTTPFLLRSMLRAVLADNYTPGMTALLEGGSSSYGTLDALGNFRTTDARKGTAVLVGGTVTVSTTEVMAGEVIRVTRTTTGGTPGHLSVGTITAATSFVINSSDGADTSTVAWEIVGR